MLHPLLQTDDVTHSGLYTEQLLSTHDLSQKGLCTENLLHTDAFTQRFLCKEAFTHRSPNLHCCCLNSCLFFCFLFLITDHLPFVLPFPSCYWCSSGGSGGCWGSYHTSRVMCQLPLSLHARVRILHCREDACEAVGRVCTADICEFLPVVPHTRRGSFKDRTL